MRLLALETTERIGSIAVLENGEVLAERRLPDDERSAAALAPAIQRLLADVGWLPTSLELIACAVGPGSFTGLRVGVTMTKTLAFATGADTIGINTLEVIGMAAPNNIEMLRAVIDAQRQQVFAGELRRNQRGWLQLSDMVDIVDYSDWLERLRPGDFVSGPALQKLQGKLPAGVKVLAPEIWAPTAVNVGRLAWLEHAAGTRHDLFALLPQYYRLSAAEEKRAHP